jgi:hypothetical protein
MTTRLSTLRSWKEFILIPVQFFQHATALTYCSLGIATAIGVLYFKIMFPKKDVIDEHPTIGFFRIFRSTEYEWLKLKLIIWTGICAGSYLLAYHQLPDWFPSLFRRD